MTKHQVEIIRYLRITVVQKSTMQAPVVDDCIDVKMAELEEPNRTSRNITAKQTLVPLRRLLRSGGYLKRLFRR